MAESTDGLKNGYIEGSALSPEELNSQYAIPLEEIASFRSLIFIYPKGEVIIQEGDFDNALYLLRFGTVEVFKGVGAARELIGTIDAVNFFGEMSIINDEARSATVKSLTKNVVVYRIAHPNMQTILTNPKWAELLVSRLCKNLAENIEQQLVVSEQVKDLLSELKIAKREVKNQQDMSAQTARNTRVALNGILYFQNIVQGLAVVGSKGWTYLDALTHVTRALISHYIPKLDETEKTVEINVIRDCLSVLEKDEQPKIFHELKQLL